MNKYGAQKITIGGVTFDSKKEAYRWHELKLLERGKVIKDLKRQVKFELLPSQKYKGEPAELAVNYIADFVYTDIRSGECVVEDTKGAKTKDYIIKRKMMLYFHGIRIKEV